MVNKAKIREQVKELHPIDDILFVKMADNKYFCQEILRTIFNDKNLTVISNKPQFKLTNLYGRSLIIDLKCELSNGTTTNVEVQKSNTYDDHLRRVRFHGAILTTNIANPNITFKEIPNVVIIYITSFDFLAKNRTIYHAKNTIQETGDPLDNGYQEIYINAEVDDGSDLAKLMKYFVGKENDIESVRKLFPKTVELKELYTNTEEGISIMTDAIEKIVKDEEKKIRDERTREIVQKMKRDNLDISLIQKYSGWTKEQILACPV